MVSVSNTMGFTTVDDNVETTVAIGLVTGSEKHDGVYLLKTIYTDESPGTYDDMVRCTAATMHALRGQYEKIQSDAQVVDPPQDAWETWCELARCLTYTNQDRYILYKINPMNGLPSFVYCEVPNAAEHKVQVRGNRSACTELYEKIKDRTWLSTASSPYQAFSQYGNILQTTLASKVISGVDTPIVANQHMKTTDSLELQWINVAMHMLTDLRPTTYKGLHNAHPQYSSIASTLKQDQQWSSQFATQIIAPYPVQWSTSSLALDQAMEMAAIKLVGHDNYKKYLEERGSAMNVVMGAAYFVIKPQTNQMHLKAMYSQDDRVMPMDSNAAFVRDITATGVRNRYLQALMVLGVT